MKLKIQSFATWDDLINDYNQSKAKAETELNALDSQKQAELDSYNQNYNNQLAEHESLMNQQQANIDTWAEEQKKQQQAQTDFNIGIINQNKEQAAKDTEAEIKDSYVDYMKQNNAYGGVLETFRISGYMSSIEPSTILSNTHKTPMYARNEKELKEKDIKEDLVFRKEIDFDND